MYTCVCVCVYIYIYIYIYIGPGVEGEEGIYGFGGVRSRASRRVCACRPHHDRSNDMLFEEF